MATVVSHRERILQVFVDRLSVIKKSAGYHTDAGEGLCLGFVPQLGPSDKAAVIAVLPAEDQVPAEQLLKIPTTWPINIAAVASPVLDDAWIAIERLLTDIKRAVELDDRTLGGLLVGGFGKVGITRGTAEVLERKSGSDVIGVAITYVCPYAETWGRPEV